MYTTSAAYQEAVKSSSRQWRVTINAALDSGDTLTLGNDDIVLGSFSYDESSICSDNLDIGATYANGVEFSIVNADNQYSDYVFAHAELRVWVGLLVGEDEWEDIPLGVFFVTEDGKKLTTIPIKALDRMYLLNRGIDTLTILPNSTLPTIFTSLSTRFGFDIEPETAAMIKSIDLVLPVFNEKITCRDFVGYTAAILGKSARFNRAGKLEFYGVSDFVYETDSHIRTELSLSDMMIQPTGVTVTDAGKESYSKGLDENPDEVALNDYVIEVAQNPLLINDDITALALENAYDALTTVPYIPYTCKVIGDPSIQCGDRIRHLDKQSLYTESIITGLKFSLRGTAALEAKGKSPQSDRQLTASAKKLIDVRDKAAKDLNDGLTNMERIILNQSNLLATSMGFFPHVEYDELGNMKAYYLMETPNPDDPSQTVWQFGLNGIGVSHTGIGGPYTSSWGANDTIVAMMITADLIRTGTLQAIDELLSIDLENGKFETKTELGTCTIFGNEIVLRYQDPGTGKPVSFMRMTADAVPGDESVTMKLDFSSDNGVVATSFEQDFDYDPDTGAPIAQNPFRITSGEGVVFDKDISVMDSIIYDNIKMQRKNAEAGNTGVDFVFSPMSR